MTGHIILFVDKEGKEVDRIPFNGPSWNFWETTVLDKWVKGNKEIYSRMEKGLSKNRTLAKIYILKCIFNPFIQYSTEEVLFKMCTAEKFKKNGAVELHYKKEEGWSGTSKELIDSKKKYIHVVYGYDDGGEFDKGSLSYAAIMAFVKSALIVKNVNDRDGKN